MENSLQRRSCAREAVAIALALLGNLPFAIAADAPASGELQPGRYRLSIKSTDSQGQTPDACHINVNEDVVVSPGNKLSIRYLRGIRTEVSDGKATLQFSVPRYTAEATFTLIGVSDAGGYRGSLVSTSFYCNGAGEWSLSRLDGPMPEPPATLAKTSGTAEAAEPSAPPKPADKPAVAVAPPPKPDPVSRTAESPSTGPPAVPSMAATTSSKSEEIMAVPSKSAETLAVVATLPKPADPPAIVAASPPKSAAPPSLAAASTSKATDPIKSAAPLTQPARPIAGNPEPVGNPTMTMDLSVSRKTAEPATTIPAPVAAAAMTSETEVSTAEQIRQLKEQLARFAQEQERAAQREAQARAAQFKSRSAHALVIGNSRYKGSPLPNAANDARAIAARLESFSINTNLVIDADRARLVSELAAFSEKVRQSDLAIIFYAGHGIQVSGTNYILPIDLDMAGPLSAITLQGIAVGTILESYLSARIKLVFLDACRDNPIYQLAGNSRGLSRGLAPMAAGAGTLISYSTRDGTVAADGFGAHSPYTNALLEFLSEPEDIALILRKVRERVMATTGGAQQPWEYGSLVGDKLILSTVAR